MAPKYFVLVFAALSLVACETTDIRSPVSKRVVRMSPIPDEPGVRVATSSTKQTGFATSRAAVTRTAPVVREPKPAETAVSEVPTMPMVAPTEAAPSAPAPTETAPTAEARTTEAAPVETAPTTPPETQPSDTAPAEPATIAATPDAPAQTAPTSDFQLSAIPALLQAMIGGMPIWLAALVLVVILAALVLGTWSTRKPRDPYSTAEPEAEPETA